MVVDAQCAAVTIYPMTARNPVAEVGVPVFFTIVSANYMAYAITLMQSLRDHYPDSPRYVVLADDTPVAPSWAEGLFELVPVRSVGLPHFEQFAFRYSILEFNTAIKPFAFAWLVELHRSTAITYIDPDILVLSPLIDVFNATSEGALAVLTPHITGPIDDDKYPDERTFLRVGIYNLGFVALGPHRSRRELISWWAARLEFDARTAPEDGLFTDQKWVDLVPSIFPDVRILRNPGYNLAYWNLGTRRLSGSERDLSVDGTPLVFVHFSGVDLRHPDVFSVHQNRFSSRSIGALRPLYARYLALLKKNGHEKFSMFPYAWGRLRDSTKITPLMRAVFREQFDVGKARDTPDPFTLPRTAFLDSPPIAVRVKRFAFELYPRLRTNRLMRFLVNRLSPESRWALRRYFTAGAGQTGIRGERSARLRTSDASHSRPAANLIGHLKGEFGVGEAARSIARSAERAGIELALVDIDASTSGRQEDRSLAAKLATDNPHRINIMCVNADQTEALVTLLGDAKTAGRYAVGYWFWELARFPAAWSSAFDYLDEIWVASSFIQDAVKSATSKPVRKIRLSVEPLAGADATRTEFNLPADKYVFLYTFDFRSYVERKNPIAAISAFRQAFAHADDAAMLVLKTTNGSSSPRSLRELEDAINADPRIRLMDGFFDRDQIWRLQRAADCYISLHRSEGFGLGLAEAMSLGKPAVATGYSGNMEFMNSGNSCLVGYELVDVEQGEYPHHGSQVWAEPDLDHAVYFMRRLVDDPQYGRVIGRRAQAHMRMEFSREAVGATIREELARIDELPAV